MHGARCEALPTAQREVHVHEQTATGGCKCSDRFDKGTAVSAIVVVKIGTTFNLYCAWLLRDVSGALGSIICGPLG